MSETSSGMNNDNLDYPGSRKNSPGISDNIPELTEYLYEVDQMPADVRSKIEGFSSPREIFTNTNEIDSTELANKEANPSKKTRQWRYSWRS